MKARIPGRRALLKALWTGKPLGAWWVCPVCGWFVGERLVHSHIGTHDQQKSNFCSRCGQKIDWEGVQDEVN